MQETLTRTLNSSERQCEALHTTYQRVVAQEAEAPEADVMAALKVAQLAVGAKAEPKAQASQEVAAMADAAAVALEGCTVVVQVAEQEGATVARVAKDCAEAHTVAASEEASMAEAESAMVAQAVARTEVVAAGAPARTHQASSAPAARRRRSMHHTRPSANAALCPSPPE